MAVITNSPEYEQLFIALYGGTEIARQKHELFAEGKYQALGVVQSEIAEFLKAVERGTDEEAVAEAMDSMIVLARFVLGEHLPEDQRGYGWWIKK